MHPSLSLYLYHWRGPPQFSLKGVTDYLKGILPYAFFDPREDFFACLKGGGNFSLDALARDFASAKVYDSEKEAGSSSPLPPEIAYEKKRLGGAKHLKGIIYDGFIYQAICRQFIARNEGGLSSCHIIFTNQLLATAAYPEKRYHLRVGIYGFPNIISLSGIVEALAKPKDYYLKLGMGINPLELKEAFKQRVIDYGDGRIEELLKGYALQALLYHLCGEAFCEDKACRFYNAHWQEEAVNAQIKAGEEFCPRHREVVAQWRKGKINSKIK